MSKPFDLEAAKAGEPVMYPSGSVVTFVGLSSSGFVVVEDAEGYFVAHEGSDLRMAPTKVKVQYRSFVQRVKTSFADHQVYSLMYGATLTPGKIEASPNFVCWIHADWQEAEVPK